MKQILFCSTLILLFNTNSFADSSGPPEQYRCYSSDSLYYLDVFPVSFVNDTIKKSCKGVLYKKNDAGAYDRIWETALLNAISPMVVHFYKNNKYILSLDNWDCMGLGENVIVVYDINGKAINSISLEKTIPENIFHKIHGSLGSIFWRDTFWVDEEKHILITTAKLTSTGFWKSKTVIDTFMIDMMSGILIR